MNSRYSLIKTWPILRYAVEINYHLSSSNERQESQHQTMDCSEGSLTLNFTTTQQFYILRDETEKIECVDLSSANLSSIFSTYTGDSLLMSYLIPNDNIQRKFLIKFASTANQTSRQHCEDCIKSISRFIDIKKFDSISLPSMSEPTEKLDSILSMKDMIKVLMGDHSIKLSTYYHQDVSFDLNETNNFLEKYLCDETFPEFVANVASILDSIKEI